MGNLLHVTIKDPENSGFTWREFFCPACLGKKRALSTRLLFLKLVRVTPTYLSGFYSPLANEPVCRDCGFLFRR